jgi:hypothetical protein
MREDVVMPPMARRLLQAGLQWEPQLGDWCTVLASASLGEAQAGLWLVAVVANQTGMLGLMDAGGQWPLARVPARECVWLPSAGKLKTYLRACGMRVATREHDTGALGLQTRHYCRAQRPGDQSSLRDGEGPNEAEAVAEVVLKVLAEQTTSRATLRPEVSELPTRRL